MSGLRNCRTNLSHKEGGRVAGSSFGPTSRRSRAASRPVSPKLASVAIGSSRAATLHRRHHGVNGTAGEKGSLRLLVLALSLGALLVFAPLWAPLVLAAWTADVVRPLALRFEHALGGRHVAAGLLTVLVVLALAGPLV